MNLKRKLRVGDWVEVRCAEEILQTLDSNGQLEGMPFMPEMLQFCGRRFRVYKRAHKTCDTVFPIRGRRVKRAVHLETRCDGSAHGGCQAGCLIFWKEAWLKPVNGPAGEHDLVGLTSAPGRESAVSSPSTSLLTNILLPDEQQPRYVCQATQLPYATSRLEWWDLRQYVEDYISGNVGLKRIVQGLAYSAYYNLSTAGIGLGRPLRWLYNTINMPIRGTLFPRSRGSIPEGAPTPTASLNLQPGELVRIKSHKEILATLNTNNFNRGMFWDAEMVPYCGKTYRVLRSVNQIIDEKTGKMRFMKNPCIILDSVICNSRYSYCRMFCPRSIYSYWREIWLERVAPSPATSEEKEPASLAMTQ